MFFQQAQNLTSELFTAGLKPFSHKTYLACKCTNIYIFFFADFTLFLAKSTEHSKDHTSNLIKSLWLYLMQTVNELHGGCNMKVISTPIWLRLECNISIITDRYTFKYRELFTSLERKFFKRMILLQAPFHVFADIFNVSNVNVSLNMAILLLPCFSSFTWYLFILLDLFIQSHI